MGFVSLIHLRLGQRAMAGEYRQFRSYPGRSMGMQPVQTLYVLLWARFVLSAQNTLCKWPGRSSANG